ncbi:hypothetical protein L916_12095 [Phytophthora nicotianae]|uniref:CXC domain-containing protein n=2 Tax=Phytophthora nicotianae TaxID=4792 RepID=W2IR05_PHYNI|nr:hypothetical protein L916_12095 [Phytophthora nicotianae]
MADPSEYVDASHISLMAAEMHSFLSAGSACSKLCWENDDPVNVNSNRTMLPAAAELGVVRKLREMMGDNSCLLSAIVGSALCSDAHELIKQDSGRRVRNWNQGRRSGGKNHELLQRTRNQRLQDRGTENHEYEPCMHEGMCDSTGCSCMKRDRMCEKACSCSRECPNRSEGCNCSPGECRTSKCPCVAALRECDPDTCALCEESEVAVLVSTGKCTPSRCAISMCGNVNVIRSKHKRLGMSFSPIHGYGMFARETISATEFVYQIRPVLSQNDADRHGLIYNKMEMSYLFDLNADARSDNKNKFINHEGDSPNEGDERVWCAPHHHVGVAGYRCW